MVEMAKALNNTLCQICYNPTEVIDGYGTWCKKCHKEYTDGILNPSKRVSVIELMKKNRK